MKSPLLDELASLRKLAEERGKGRGGAQLPKERAGADEETGPEKKAVKEKKKKKKKERKGEKEWEDKLEAQESLEVLTLCNA